jgi:DNA-binding NarL/FixJ family response regulator
VTRQRTARRATRLRAIRMVIVEHHALVRAVLRQIVEDGSDIEIVAEAIDIDDAIERMRHDPADVILIDTEDSIAKVVPSIRRLRREYPETPVVLLGHLRDDDELFAAIQTGAAAHVLDDTPPSELLQTIRDVADGQYVIDDAVAARPAVARHVLEAFRDASLFGEVLEDDTADVAFAPLSPREAEVLDAIAHGLTNKGVAEALSISEQTVKNHVTSILRKLAVNHRTQAVLHALKNNWISDTEEPTRFD